MDSVLLWFVVGAYGVVAFLCGRWSMASEVADAITRDHAICCDCGAILPFAADGELYRCTTCIGSSRLPRVQGPVATATKPPSDGAA